MRSAFCRPDVPLTGVNDLTDVLFPVPPAPSSPIRVDVHRDGSKWIGNLVWTDGMVWPAWQVARTLTALKHSARCTFDGPIVRVTEKDI